MPALCATAGPGGSAVVPRGSAAPVHPRASRPPHMRGVTSHPRLFSVHPKRGAGMDTLRENFEEALRRSAGWSIVVAFGAIVCGIIAIAAPMWGAYVATVTFGCVALAAGVL